MAQNTNLANKVRMKKILTCRTMQIRLFSKMIRFRRKKTMKSTRRTKWTKNKPILKRIQAMRNNKTSQKISSNVLRMLKKKSRRMQTDQTFFLKCQSSSKRDNRTKKTERGNKIAKTKNHRLTKKPKKRSKIQIWPQKLIKIDKATMELKIRK